ncbi:FkbM family methyltransferase [Geothrix sp. 21YS21S-2]|uniref:FkbM family methyltransferase n=1 Tax=Geothrix sp. 21YS21S-2 TaxID=3068893 RepID=UPI0027B8DDA9|nr:FkbM family methyltransferase [Geothrix sp. 21YS21S-2]
MINFFSHLHSRRLRIRNFLEIGSRDGEDANTFAKAAGIRQVHVIEPAPQSFARIQAHFPFFQVYNLALSNRNGHQVFHNIVDPDLNKQGMSSLMPREIYERFPSENILVELMRGDTFLDKYGIQDISACKIDVEGHAVEVLEGFGTELTRIHAIHLECETVPVWEGQRLFGEAKALLEGRGFQMVSYWEYNQPTTQCDSIWLLAHNRA